MIIKSECKGDGEGKIYLWWMKYHKESVGMTKRLLECIGISCDDALVTSSLQHYQGKIILASRNHQQNAANKSARSGYLNRFG